MPGKMKNSKLLILQAFENSFKAFAEICPTGIYLADIYGKYVYVNPAWCKMAGLTLSEAEGDGWVNAIHSLDRDRIQPECKNHVPAGLRQQRLPMHALRFHLAKLAKMWHLPRCSAPA